MEPSVSTPNKRNRNRGRDRDQELDLKRASLQPGEETPTSSGISPILPTEEFMFESKMHHDIRTRQLQSLNKNYDGEDDHDEANNDVELEDAEKETSDIPTILTEERATFSRIAPFLSKQRSRLWLPLALALSFTLVLLFLRSVMVDTPMLPPENWLSPFGQSSTTHRIAHTDRRQDLKLPHANMDNIDDITSRMESDLRDLQEIKNSLYKLDQPHMTQRNTDGSLRNYPKGQHSHSHLLEEYQTGKEHVRDALHHIPEELKDARRYMHDKIHNSEAIHSLEDQFHRHHRTSPTPSFYQRVVSWFNGSPSQSHTTSMLPSTEPHPELQPHFIDELHFAREGQLRKEMETKLADAVRIHRQEQKKSNNPSMWKSISKYFSTAEDEMHSDLVSVKEDIKDTFKVITPQLREFLDKHTSPHAKNLLKELEELEKKGKSYAEENKGHLNRIRDTTKAIINHGLLTLESAKDKIIEGKNDVISKVSPSSSSLEVQSEPSSHSESISLLEESMRHINNLVREETEHQFKVVSEYGRHSASSISEWMRHEREKARIHALAQDKDMSDHHHDAPGLLFDPLAV